MDKDRLNLGALEPSKTHWWFAGLASRRPRPDGPWPRPDGGRRFGGERNDLVRAVELDQRYRSLEFGLVEGIVMAVAERLRARVIATLDLRDFGPVELAGCPRLWPRDL